MQEQTKTVTDSFIAFYNNLISQLPGIGLALLIVVLGSLIATWLGQFTSRRISKKTHDPLMSRFLGKAIKYLLI
ncbi:MAG: mechanosensitive ion channel family protein, partial [Aquaticitalea sp.]